MTMSREIAREFLESIIARVVLEPATGKHHLPGVLSPQEIQALSAALEALGGTIPSQQAQPSKPPELVPPQSTPEESARLEPQQRSAKSSTSLVLDSLRSARPENPEILLCLDFGTAMSKAFACVVEDGVAVEYLGLRLGHRAQPGPLIYPVPSSLWIADDGRIYVGPKAVALSLAQDPVGARPRFDSLKRELTQGETGASPDQIRLGPDVNPSNIPLSQGDAITLYLSFLTDLACTELAERHGRSRNVYRRFALPSWSAERRIWGEQMLAEMLARAQIVADTFHGRWNEGIPAGDAKRVLDSVRELSKRPAHLIGSGVPEPLAAGASHLRRDETVRGLAMVVDVGAGTSDFALFVVAEHPEEDIFRAWPVQKCSEGLSMAGDALDNALRKVILEAARVDTRDPDWRHVNTRLTMEIRQLKEQLFRDQNCTFTLTNGVRGSVTLASFLERPEVVHFRDRLAETFNKVMLAGHQSFFKRLHPGGLTVVLTGGGATLPMVNDLVGVSSEVYGYRMERKRTPLVPRAFAHDSELREAYPQLAVAIGGAQPDLLGEGEALEEMPGLEKQTWTLGRYQVTGM